MSLTDSANRNYFSVSWVALFLGRSQCPLGRPLKPCLRGLQASRSIRRSIAERGNKATEEIRKKMGTVEIAVALELIRETRNECD